MGAEQSKTRNEQNLSKKSETLINHLNHILKFLFENNINDLDGLENLEDLQDKHFCRKIKIFIKFLGIIHRLVILYHTCQVK